MAGPDGEIVELAVPVRDSDNIYGVLIVEARGDFLFESRHRRLVDAVAGLFALSLGNLQRNQRRVVLIEAAALDLHVAVPLETEVGQGSLNTFGGAGDAARRIDIFNPQQPAAALRPRIKIAAERRHQ